MGILTASIATNIDLAQNNTAESLLQEVKRQSMLGMRYSPVLATFSDLSPGLSERMNIVYQHGKDVPDNTPDGTEIKAFFDYHTGSISLFQFIIFEQAMDQPLRIKSVFNSARYSEESVAAFSGMFVREIETILSGKPA